MGNRVDRQYLDHISVTSDTMFSDQLFHRRQHFFAMSACAKQTHVRRLCFDVYYTEKRSLQTLSSGFLEALSIERCIHCVVTQLP